MNKLYCPKCGLIFNYKFKIESVPNPDPITCYNALRYHCNCGWFGYRNELHNIQKQRKDKLKKIKYEN